MRINETRVKPATPNSGKPSESASDRLELGEFDVGREIAGLDRLVAHQVGAQIFLVAVAENGGRHGASTQLVLHLDRGQKVSTGRNADGQAQLRRKLLRQQD